MLFTSFFAALGLISLVHCSPVQHVLEIPAVPAAKPRPLHGRFLQISDLHPDPWYEPLSSVTKACHRPNKNKKKNNRAGYYGTPYEECDSPLRLIDYTIDFLEKNWAGDIDFVIWTGDNARHDEDPKLPRTTKEIYDTNRSVAKKMTQAFTDKGIPVIPSLGNNDIWPHNILTPGPNSITDEFSRIWQPFIPFPYLQVFERGAYFAVEVVPNALAVISLNTLYFYDSNKAVGGCNYNEPDDPGNLQFDWLEVQLKIFRDRGMQVWLTGHVPPSSSNYFPECYVRYVDLALRFQNIVLGHLYGHMNMDHFFFIEAGDLEFHNETRVSKHKDLCDWLLQDFGLFPKLENIDMDEYAAIAVAPPLVPNPYLPSFRIFNYNITGVENALDSGSLIQHTGIDVLKERLPSHHRGQPGDKDSLCSKEHYRDSWKCKLRFRSPSKPDSPSRLSQLWTPTGFTQYFIPSLSLMDADKKDHPRFKLEYTTFPAAALLPGPGQNESEFRYPIPLKNLPKSVRKGQAKKKYFPYEMQDLTLGSWLELARRLGDSQEKKLRKMFRQFMYLGGKE